MRVKFRGEASRLLLAAVLFGAGAAQAQDYPDSIEAPVLTAWLGRSTNIAPATVVSVTPELVVAIAGKTMPATAGGPVRLTLREEVIVPSYVQTVGGRSSLMSMEIHCDERRLRMDERRLFSGANLTGSVEISDPSAEWVRIPEGSIMDEVARAACDAEYAWPLRFAGASATNMAVAALDTSVPLLPPGPDAKPVDDEPPIEEKAAIVAQPIVPEPEAVPPPETAVEVPTEIETVFPVPAESPAEPAMPAEIVAAPEAESPPVTPEQVVADTEPAPPTLPEVEQTPATPGQAAVEAASPVENAAPPEAEIAPPLEQAVIAVEPEKSAPSPAIELALPVERVEVAVAPVEPAPIAEIPSAEVAPPVIAQAAPAAPEIPASPAAEPAFAVQIGAYETSEAAQAAWMALSARRPVLVEGLGFEIRPVRVKGKDWLRGLVGRFASRKDAAAFCTAIAGGEYGCILRTLAD